MRPLQRTRKGAPQAWHQPRAGRRASACASAHRRGPSGVGSSQHEQYPQQQRQQQDLAPAGAETPLPPPAASTSTPLPPPTPALPPPAPPLTLTEPAERFREWLRQRRELLRLAAEWLLYHYYNTRSPATDLQLLAFAYVSTMLLLAAAQHYTLDAPGVAFWADLYRVRAPCMPPCPSSSQAAHAIGGTRMHPHACAPQLRTLLAAHKHAAQHPPGASRPRSWPSLHLPMPRARHCCLLIRSPSGTLARASPTARRPAGSR